MPRSKSSNDSSSSERVRPRIKLYLFILTVAAIGGAAFGVFLVRQPIVDGLNQVQESVLTAVGLGVAPMAMWVGALALALVFKRRWLLNFNLWLAAAVLVVGLAGAFAFFRPLEGPLGWFSGYGYSTLGGSFGDAVIGSQGLFGAVRLFAVLLLAAAIAVPILAMDVGRLVGQGLLVTYLAAFIGIRSLLSRERSESPADSPPETTAPQLHRDVEAGRNRRTAGSWAVEPALQNAAAGSRLGLEEVLSHEDSGSGPAGRSTMGEDLDDDPMPGAQAMTASVEDDPDFEDDLFEVDSTATSEPEPEPIGTHPFERNWPAEGPKSNRLWSSDGEQTQPAVTTVQERPQRMPVISPRAPANGSGLLWQCPPIDLFKDTPEMPISREELKGTADTITQTLGEYGVEVEVGHVRPGPTVTMYGLVPGWVRRSRVAKQLDDDGQPIRDESGRQVTKRVEQNTRVKVDSILAREKDLALALKTPAIRIETPAMGKSLVGIEVPNPNPSLVTLRNVMGSREFQKMRKDAHLPVALGRGSGGEAVCFDLAKMPHLLVAGATGSGKSVCLNAIVSCVITEKTPVQVRLLLVDPKRVELTPYNGIPHLMAPVIVETDTVVGYLKGLIREMFVRYRMMEEAGVRNIEAYNKRTPDNMPYLCVVIDELADLMMTAAFEVEQSICRLAQLGRATGIHLIIATQRPSVDVVTGLIKANFPSRISFGVTSQVDSRTILDTAGADKLLGRGDMLYLPLDASRPSRVQSVFIGDDEIGDLVNFWQETPWPPFREIDLLGGEDLIDDDGIGVSDDPNRDDMTDRAIELAQTHRKLSTSLLQRRLRIGYPRAARLMDQLEEEGVVGPGDGSKSRDVIINQV